MTTNVKEAIGLIITGASILLVSYMLLIRQTDIKNDILTFTSTERILHSEVGPLTTVIDRYRSAYKTPDELIPNRVMATLDSLNSKKTMLDISMEKARDQIALYEKTVDMLNIVLAILLIAGVSCLFLGVIRYLK